MSDLPDFLKREHVTITTEDKLMCEECFTPRELAHITPAELIVKVSQRCDRYMEQAGAIAPFAYSCRPWNGWFVLKVEEL